MDAIDLLNNGTCSPRAHLDKKVYRVEYTLGNVTVPIIEKCVLRPSHVGKDAAHLEYWRRRGLRVPEIVVASTDPRLVRQPERDHPAYDKLFLSDLTDGNKHPIIDLYAEEKSTFHMQRLPKAHLDSLENAAEIREELAHAFALFASERVQPRADYFFVALRGNHGTLYCVDIEYYQKLKDEDFRSMLAGKPRTDFLLHYSGISRLDEITARTIEILRTLEPKAPLASKTPFAGTTLKNPSPA